MSPYFLYCTSRDADSILQLTYFMRTSQLNNSTRSPRHLPIADPSALTRHPHTLVIFPLWLCNYFSIKICHHSDLFRVCVCVYDEHARRPHDNAEASYRKRCCMDAIKIVEEGAKNGQIVENSCTTFIPYYKWTLIS